MSDEGRWHRFLIVSIIIEIFGQHNEVKNRQGSGDLTSIKAFVMLDNAYNMSRRMESNFFSHFL